MSSKPDKRQQIRLIDVFIVAPFLIYTGVKYRKNLPQFISTGLVVLGVLTAFYNGNHYLKNV